MIEMEIATPQKPDTRKLWGLTLAAAFDLIALVFMVASNSKPILLVVFAACEFVLIVASAVAWKKYIDQSIDYRIHCNMERD